MNRKIRLYTPTIVLICTIGILLVVAQPAPFIITGSVLYTNGTQCSDPAVNITNLNTSDSWNAATSAGDNKYLLVVDTSRVYVNDTFAINASDGSNFNLTEHTITDYDLMTGGLSDLDIVLPSEEPLPDLVVTGITTPESPYLNYSYTIGVTVENIGGSEIATPFNVSLKANETVIGNETVNALSAGETSIINFTWTPRTTAYYNLTAVADPENIISESNETNNQHTKNTTVIKEPKPDLVVKEIRTSGMIYSNISNMVTATVENMGDVNAERFRTGLFGTNRTLLSEKIVSGLGANDTTTIEFEWTPTHAGDHTILVTADSHDELAELNETNNNRTTDITVIEIPDSDLRVMEIETETIFASELNPIKARIRNIGRDAGGFNITLDVDGSLVDEKEISSLRFNTTAVAVFGWVPSEEGSHTINITVDPENAVNESNETNNRITKEVNVNPEPSWRYEMNITIENLLDPLHDYPVLLTLDPSIFDYPAVLGQGEDISFEDEEENPIPYWIEIWNTSGESRVWLRLDDVLAGREKRIEMHYGNASVPSRSDGNLVFDFFEGFECGTDCFGGWSRCCVRYAEKKACYFSLFNDTPDNSSYAASITARRWEGCTGTLYRNISIVHPLLEFRMKSEAEESGKLRSGALIGDVSTDDTERIFETENVTDWRLVSVNLSAFAGRSVDLGFFAENNWWDYNVSTFVDNIRLRESVEQEPFVDYGYADIIPTEITPRFRNLYANFTNQIYVKIVNDGTADAREFNVTLFADDTEIDATRITIPHKSNKTVEFVWNPSIEGNYSLTVVTDAGDVVDETDETNNTTTLAVYANSPLVWGSAFVDDVPIKPLKNESVGNATVLLTLDPSIFDYTKANPDGSDIRLKDGNGTDLPYWIEEWNTSTESRIWFRVDIPQAGRTVHLCYGNASAQSESNASAVTALFEDWEGGDASLARWSFDWSGCDGWGFRQIEDAIVASENHSLTISTGINVDMDMYCRCDNQKEVEASHSDFVFGGWFYPEQLSGKDAYAAYAIDLNVSGMPYHLLYGAFDYRPANTSDTFYFPLFTADETWHRIYRSLRYDLEQKGVNVTGEIFVENISQRAYTAYYPTTDENATASFDDVFLLPHSPAIADLGYADIAPTDITPKIGRFYANYTRNPVVVTVENTGTADARDFNISLLINNELVGTKTGFVPHRANRSFEFNWTPPNAGNYTMYVEVDDIDVVNETDEENNNLTIEIDVNSDFSWRYNYVIPVRYTGEDLKNVSVLITLDPSLFNYSLAQDGGGDIRFEDTNETPLPYWIEEWDRTGESRIWVRLDVPDGGTEVRLLYGCEDVLSEDDPSGVVTLFENWDCEGMDGWVYSGGDGVTTVDVSDQTLRMYSVATSSYLYRDLSINSSAPFFSGWIRVEKLDSNDAAAMYMLDLNVSNTSYHLCYGIFNGTPSDTEDTFYLDPIVGLDGEWHRWHRNIKDDLESMGITTTGEIEVTKVMHYTNEISAYFDDLAIISSHPNITAGSAELAPIRIAPRLNRTYIDYPNEILVDIRNNGTADARDFNVTLYEAGKIIDTERIPIIKHKSEMPVEFVWKPESTGNHTLRVEADPRNTVEELNETNNNLTIELCVVVKDMPDLTIRNLTTPDEIRLNCSIVIETTIENLGMSVGAFNLSLCADETPIENRTINTLQSGENTTINFTWIPDDTGDHTLTITLDPDNEIEELNEENNNTTIDVTVVAPDLTLEVKRRSHYYLNHPNVINVSVTNDGTASSEGFNVSFYVDGSMKEEKRIVTLDRDKTKTSSFDWNSSEPGNHTLAIEVDRNHEIDESNESNNYLSMEVCAIESPESDIAITNVTTKKRFYANTANMITVMVKNGGTQNESFDVTLSEDGAPVVVKRVDNLPAHTGTSLRFAWIPRGTEENLPKNCTLVIEADSGNEINESCDDNNRQDMNVTLEYIAVPASPVLVHGNASYTNNNPCTTFSVNITKNNETFVADTFPGLARYLSMLGVYPNDIYPDPCNLTINATDGVSINRTERTITDEELISGEVTRYITFPVQTPDLYVKSIDLPARCYLNTTLMVNATIENYGRSVNESFNISFTVDNETLGVEMVNSLNVTENKMVSFEWTPENAGKYDLTVFVDSDCEIEEANEYNNNLTIAGVSTTAPDLVVDGIDPPYDLFVNISNTINITVRNIGDVDVDVEEMGQFEQAERAFGLRLFARRVNENGTCTVDGWTGGLNVSESRVVSLSWTPAETGKYVIYAVVDPAGEIDESNETNNNFTIEEREVYEPMDVAMVLVSGVGDTYFRSFKAPLNCTVYNATVKACTLIGEWSNQSEVVYTEGNDITGVADITDPQFYLYNATVRSWGKSDANASSPELSDGTVFGWTIGIEPPLPLPDLTPTEIVMPRTLYLGRMIPVTTTIENNGIAGVSDVLVSLDLRHEAESNWTSVASDTVSVDPHKNTTITLKWLAGEVGEYNVRIVIDPSNHLNESNESNNEIDMTAAVVRGFVIDVPRDFPTIREAVEDAAPDTVIYVHEGVYSAYEHVLDENGVYGVILAPVNALEIVNKHNITIIGDNWDTVITPDIGNYVVGRTEKIITIKNSSGISFINLAFRSSESFDDNDIFDLFVHIENSKGIVFDNCKFKRDVGHEMIQIFNSSDCTFSNSLLYNPRVTYDYYRRSGEAGFEDSPAIFMDMHSDNNILFNNTFCKVCRGIRVEGDNNRIYHNNLYREHSFEYWKLREDESGVPYYEQKILENWTVDRVVPIASDAGANNSWDDNYWGEHFVVANFSMTVDCDGSRSSPIGEGTSENIWRSCYSKIDTNSDGIRDEWYASPDSVYGDPVTDYNPLIEPYGVEMDARIKGVVVPNRVYANRTNAIFVIVARTTRDIEPRSFDVSGFADGERIGNETLLLDGYLSAEELDEYIKFDWEPNVTGMHNLTFNVTTEITDVDPSNNLMELDLDVLEMSFDHENIGSAPSPSSSTLSPAWCSMAVCAMGNDPHHAGEIPGYWEESFWGGDDVWIPTEPGWFDERMKQDMHTQLEYNTGKAPRFAGEWGTWVLGIVASGEDPRDFGGVNYFGMLKSYYNGESMGNEKSGDVVWDDAMSLLAFDASEEVDQEMVTNVCNDLIGRQDADGSWKFPYNPHGRASDTAIVVQAIIASGNSDKINESVNKGLNYLKGVQNEDGSFPHKIEGSRDVLATSHALQAIIAAGERPHDWDGTLIDYLNDSAPVQENYIFNVTNISGLEEDLNNGKIPDVLDRTFGSEGYPLIHDATVNTTENDCEWIVIDGAEEYILKKYDDVLNVYVRQITLGVNEQAARIPALLGEPYPVARLILQEEPCLDLCPILVDPPYHIYNMTNCTINGIIRSNGGRSPATLLANGTPVGNSTATSVWAKGSTEIHFRWKPEHDGEYNLSIASDYYGRIDETDETNNIRTIFVTVKKPDLKPVMSLRSNTVNVTNIVDVTISGKTDESFNVTFLEGNRTINTTRVHGIDGSTKLIFHWMPVETGFYNLTVFADSNCEIYESNEPNNNYTKHVMAIKPDLFVKSLKIPTIYSNATNPIYLDIGGVADAFNVSLFVNGTNVCKQKINADYAEEDLKTTLHWKPNRTGWYDVRVFVDSDDDVSERDDGTNNNWTDRVKVILPDLVPLEIAVPAHVYYNETNEINITITGAGDDFNVTLIVDGGYAYVNATKNSSISATLVGKSINVSFYGNTSVIFDWIPQRLGICNLTVLVDPDCDLYESDETNNNLTREVHVVEHVPIELRSPRGGEIWVDTEDIKWDTTFQRNLTIDIDYSPNKGQRWEDIVRGTDDDGSYAWNTTNVSDGYNYLIKVVANGEDAYGEDTSNTFTIYNTGSAEAWEGFHANAGFSLSTAPDSANCVWVTSEETYANPSSSVCVADGKVIVFCTDSGKGWVTAFDEETGVRLWTSDTWDWNFGSWATPAYSNGKVYMMGSEYILVGRGSEPDSLGTFVLSTINATTGATDKKHYLVNETDASGVPVNGGVLVAYGTQFFSTYDDGLYYKVGNTVDPPSLPGVTQYSSPPQGWDWRFEVDGKVAQSTPAAATGLGKIYFGDYSDAGGNGTLYCVEQSTGNLAWKKKLESGLCGSPTAVNGNVYLTTYGFYSTPSGTYAFDASTGNLTWNKIWGDNKRPSDSTPAYAPFDDGYVYVAGGGWSDSPYVVCFDDRDGSIVWDDDKSNFNDWVNDSSQYNEQFGVGHWTNSPVVSIDEKVFVGKPAGGDAIGYIGLFCLDAKTGKERWHSDYGGSTAAIANGRVYTTGDGKVYAFGPEERPDLIPNDITVVYPPAYEGLDNLINVTVENIGTEDAGDFNVSLGYADVEIGIASISSLARGATANATFRWTPPAAGNYTLQATVNSDMRVNENLFNNRMDNDITVLSTPPDIAVTDINSNPSSPIYAGDLCTITADIINYGEPASNFDVSLTANEDLIGSTVRIHDLDFGDPKSVDFRWVPSDPGNYTLTVFADCKNTIIESDETNNKNSINVTVLLKPIPTPTPIGLGDGDGGGIGDGGGSHVWRDGEGDGTGESEAVTSGAETFVNETEPAEGAEKKAKGFPMGAKFLGGGGGGGTFSLAMLIAALILMGLLIYGTRKERERYRKARR